jgi:hypothetical protein
MYELFLCPSVIVLAASFKLCVLRTTIKLI